MRRNFLLIIVLQLVVSCAPLSREQARQEQLAYLVSPARHDLFSRFLPVFIIEKQHKAYNRIGTPKAELTANGENIYVDPGEAGIYIEKRQFATDKDTYTNLIYRIHFEKTPYGLFPFQLGAGRNVGLFVVVTLNSDYQPVLYTTVHTCGCYLAFIPTTYLSRDAFPTDWPEEEQIIYAETLPSLVDLKNDSPESPALMILIKDASHRVKDVRVASKSETLEYPTDTAAFYPLASLEHLQLIGTDRTTSFFETSGPHTGYVKCSHKPLERILMSWWAFDWRVGEDKRIGKDRTEPPIFYTSLKFWARTESDMRDFPEFISYWGWKL